MHFDFGVMLSFLGDGCNAACHLESGWTCLGQGEGSCVALCGDGILVSGEECDGLEFGDQKCVQRRPVADGTDEDRHIPVRVLY